MEKQQELKRTSLFKEHQKLGANFGEFAGWHLPLSYLSVQEEVLAVRKKAGLFDVSHMGRILIWGADARDFLQKMVAADLKNLGNAKALYTLLCLEDNGRILDDLIVLKAMQLFLGELYILVVNAINTEKDLNHLIAQRANNKSDVIIDDRTKETSMIALQGPGSENILKKLDDISDNLIPQKRHEFSNIRLWGLPLLISRTGYTGEDGFEIILPAVNAPMLWQKLLMAEARTITPCGLIARDILRLEAGLPLYGQEIDENINPSIKTGGKLVGFEVLSGRIARHGSNIIKDGRNIGFVTSGCFSPTLEKSIGMGYVNSQFSQVGTEIAIDLRGTMHKAKIVLLPFYRRRK